MAMECGCSGVLGGRAFWKEYFLQDGADARSHFAATDRREARRRRRCGRPRQRHPWFAKYGLTKEDLTPVRAAEGWHARYAIHATRWWPQRPRRPRRRSLLIWPQFRSAR